MATFLLDEAKVMVIAGESFGSDEHIRLSYAISLNDLEKGLNRIEQTLKQLE
ncbi:MAG: hypothetical protein SVW57_05120 [Thermodesulfobacteriota bacterium]|nr:hypothetical protein [Thermodesulfobacteriota bacterium]